MKTKLGASAVAFITFVFPLATFALTQAQIDQQVQSLILQATVLQQKIVTASLSTTTNVVQPLVKSEPPVVAPVVVSTSSTSSCPVITTTLTLGSQGSAVSGLQQFLAQDTAIYPEGKVTGYFGARTQAAVQRFQVQFGIVSSGDPASTGYGVVGSKTRAAIAKECKTGLPIQTTSSNPSSCPVANPPMASCTTGWKAIVGTDGCTTAYKCSITLNPPLACPAIALSCAAGYYDSVATSTCAHTCVSLVNASSSSATLFNPTLSATPTAGTAPLSVTFSGVSPTANYTLDFGDGTPAVSSVCSKSCAANVYIQQNHTYQTQGVYTATVKIKDAASSSWYVTFLTVTVK